MTDPTANVSGDVAHDSDGFDGAPTAGAVDGAEELSARARTQRRLSQARSAVSDATIRARRAAPLPARQKHAATDDDAPSAAGTALDRVQAYRTYILGAAGLLALIAVARRRRSATSETEDSVDLGTWHLHADLPADEE